MNPTFLILALSLQSEPVSVGTRTQLFVDDHVVSEMTDVTRRLGRVTKANGGKPVFTDGWFYGTVLREPDFAADRIDGFVTFSIV